MDLLVPSPIESDAWAEDSKITTAQISTSAFALIIGIDHYKSGSISLYGCVADSENISKFIQSSFPISQECVQTFDTNESVSEFLENSTGATRKRILVLQDEAATRHNIISTFETHLINNTDIKKGDAMIFYFAGHGSRQSAPKDWYADYNMMETICPYDYDPQATSATKGTNHNHVYGIPDRTVGALLRRLAEKQGNNITAIFDSCHSGGIGRLQTVGVRRRNLPPISSPFPSNLDREIWSKDPAISSRSSCRAVTSSHVLLAACRPEESAFEAEGDKSSGAFTTALIAALGSCNPHRTSYSRLFDSERLSTLPNQHPYCEGRNKNRILFSASDVGGDQLTTFGVSEDAGRYYAGAGSILGVVEGTEFVIISSTGVFSAIAISVGSHRCEVELNPRDSTSKIAMPGSRAVVKNWNRPSLRVSFSLPGGTPKRSLHPSGRLFDVVDSDEHLRVTGDGDRLQLERCDSLIPNYATPYVSLKHNNVTEVLNAVSHFNFFLYKRGPQNALANAVTAKIRPLATNDNGNTLPTGNDLFRPIKGIPGGQSNTIPTGKYLSKINYFAKRWRTETADALVSAEAVIWDLDARYGLTLENRSAHDLFLYVFYFDPSDYSIARWYLPHSHQLPSLPRKNGRRPSILPIGYGASGTENIEFSLPNGATRDSGFLKIFASTSFINMEFLEQESPLLKLSRQAKLVKALLGDLWYTWTYVLTCESQPFASRQEVY